MLNCEYKVAGTKRQYAAIDEAIRIVQFIRNKCLRLWMDTPGTKRNDLQCYCAVLAKQYPFVHPLNSQARQASADRAWCAISRFYDNCQQQKPGKKGYPRFQHENRSLEYKTTGWKLEPDGRHIRFTDGCGIGKLKLVGNPGQQIESFPLKQIKRVRMIKRADGYYVQFCEMLLARLVSATGNFHLDLAICNIISLYARSIKKLCMNSLKIIQDEYDHRRRTTRPSLTSSSFAFSARFCINLSWSSGEISTNRARPSMW